MQIYPFTPAPGKGITSHGSRAARISPVATLADKARVDCIHLEAGGVLGYHPAAANQLFLVIDGSGLVRAGESAFVPVSAGQAIFWTAGEWHETRSEHGLTALVLEGAYFQPEAAL